MPSRPSPSFLSSALWVLGWRWTDRLFGLISTIILARLLLPSDFGVIVLASVVIGFIDTIFDLSVHIPLIQKKDASRADFDTAWTLRLIQSAAAGTVIFLLATPAAEYFNDPRVAPVMQVLALALVFVGLENIGIIYFQRELRFRQDYWFFFIRRVSGFAVAIIVAWYLRSYWALVAGTVAGRAVGLFASYALHPYRPRLTLQSFRSLWSVSQWALVRNVTAYVETRIDKLAIGKIAGAPTAGAYATAEEFALVPISEFLAPLGRALLPVFANANVDAERLRLAYLRALEMQCLIAIPAAVGLHCISPELVVVLLGENWLAAIPFLAALALVGIAVALTHAATYVFMATGKMALLACLTLFQLSVLACLLLFTWKSWDAAVIPWLRLAAASAVVPPVLYFLKRTISGFRLLDFGKALVRPALAAAAMYAVLMAAFPPNSLEPITTLVLKILVGAASYCAAVLFLWLASGRPTGPESSALAAIRTLLAREDGG